jgi:hypothetical protein
MESAILGIERLACVDLATSPEAGERRCRASCGPVWGADVLAAASARRAAITRESAGVVHARHPLLAMMT